MRLLCDNQFIISIRKYTKDAMDANKSNIFQNKVKAIFLVKYWNHYKLSIKFCCWKFEKITDSMFLKTRKYYYRKLCCNKYLSNKT